MSVTYFNLTNPQKAIWMNEQFLPDTNINCMGGAIKIFEKIDFDLLEKAFNIMLEKNDGLRLRFVLNNGTPFQYIKPFSFNSVEVVDISEKDFDLYTSNFIPPKFNLIDSDLYSFKMYRFENGNGAYIAYLHHLICDAWTTALFTNQIITIYSNLKNNQPDQIESHSYTEFIENEKKYLFSKRFLQDKEFWENQFKIEPSIISFKENPESFSTEFKRFSCTFPKELQTEITNIASSCNSSLPALFLSVYSLYFSKLFGTKEFIIGNPVLNRSSFIEKKIFGTFISTLPSRIEYKENVSFVDRVTEITRNQSSMYRHLKYPYQEILNDVRSKFDIKSNLYDVIFSYQNTYSVSNDLNIPFIVNWIPSNNQVESLMIHIADTNSTGNITINYDYQTSVFSEYQIEMMHDRIVHIFEQIISEPNILCKEIEIVSLKEKNLLLNTFNNTYCDDYDRYTTIIEEFQKRVDLSPDNIALTFGDDTLTYLELNSAANHLANLLLEKGIKPNDIVGIMLPRSMNIIISILAILKIGATYMPVEPEYPTSRITYMLENSLATLLITDKNLSDSLAECKFNLFLIDNFEKKSETIYENINLDYSPDSLAYIMYTSGTTGLPKAVMIKNSSVINFANAMRKRLDYSASSLNKVLSVTTMCFDIFVFEVFPTLIYGLNLVMANEDEQKNPVSLSNLIEKEGICKILTTPSRIQLLFLDSKYLNCLKTLKEIVLGGEPFPIQFLEKLPSLTAARVLNLYGPTETTVYSTFKDLTHENEITIGKPIDNTSIYILDENQGLVPLGNTGVLYIGGDGVASGYYKNPDLTSERFIQNPYGNGIIYNTGDLAKWLPNGELVCLRKDR